jgi:hypothetical protein
MFSSFFNKTVALLTAPLRVAEQSDDGSESEASEGESAPNTPAAAPRGDRSMFISPRDERASAPTKHAPRDERVSELDLLREITRSSGNPIYFRNGVRYVGFDAIETVLPLSDLETFRAIESDIKRGLKRAVQNGSSATPALDADAAVPTKKRAAAIADARAELAETRRMQNDNGDNSDFDEMEKDKEGWIRV